MDNPADSQKPKTIPAGWVPAGPALAWIAFGSAESPLTWDTLIYPGAHLWFDYSPWEIGSAMKRTAQKGAVSAYESVPVMPMLRHPKTAEELALKASALAQDMKANSRKYAAKNSAMWQAADDLRHAIGCKDLPAFGRRGPPSDDEWASDPDPITQARERIPQEVCAAPVTITQSGILPFVKGDWVLGGYRFLWHDVVVFGPDLLRHWPAPSDGKPTIPYSPPPEPPAERNRNRGGRPARDDWSAFEAELCRRLSLDGGHITRTTLRREMKDWCGENMDPSPDARTIERKIDRMTATSVFASE